MDRPTVGHPLERNEGNLLISLGNDPLVIARQMAERGITLVGRLQMEVSNTF